MLLELGYFLDIETMVRALLKFIKDGAKVKAESGSKEREITEQQLRKCHLHHEIKHQ